MSDESPRDRFESMYHTAAPWEVGHVQPFVEALAARGAFEGRVLDVGCGTGENALFLAGQGHAVVGVDIAPTAIAAAEQKARERGVKGVSFGVHDALELAALGTTFDTILDSAVFHVFPDEARQRYAFSLARAARPGTHLHLLCFSDQEPNWGGPRRVTQQEIRETFRSPWAVESIVPAEYEIRVQSGRAKAWLATIVYIGRTVSRGN